MQLCGEFSGCHNAYFDRNLNLKNLSRVRVSAVAENDNNRYCRKSFRKSFSHLLCFKVNNDVEIAFVYVCKALCRVVKTSFSSEFWFKSKSNSNRPNKPNAVPLPPLSSYLAGISVNLLLLQCGDIEANPGPGPESGFGSVAGHQVNDAPDAQHATDTSANDPAVMEDLQGANVMSRKDKDDLQVISLNVRGLGDSKKGRHLINACYKRCSSATNSIFLFQESFVQSFNLLNYLWRGEYHLTPGTGASKGCLTLVTPPYKIVRAENIGERAHVLVLTKDNTNRGELIVANAYAPNGLDNNKLEFFRALTDIISNLCADFNCNDIILGGDLNVVFSQEEVKNRLFSPNEQRIARSVRQMFHNLNLKDGWDEASKREFTWTSNRTGQPSFSTLDRILYTDGLKLHYKTTDWSLCLSDHAAVIATFKKSFSTRNNSALPPRLDPRILLDQEGKREMDVAFRDLVNQALPNWNPHVRLEYLKMSIRTATNLAISKVKAKLRDDETVLNTDINNVVSELMQQNLRAERKELLMHKLDDLRQLKRGLIEKIGTKLEQKTA